LAIFILGASGQIGSALLKACKGQGQEAVGFCRSTFDLSQPSSLLKQLSQEAEKIRPTALINAAAYTQVDRAEQEPELAYQINAISPGILAQWCFEKGIPLIHYSTDYVFSGEGIAPWKEADSVNPPNVYGKTKLQGEEKIAEASHGKWLIFRTSWVYDANGKNFFRTMLRLGLEKETLQVVNDQVGSPTFARHLADATLLALKKAQSMRDFPTGIYHLCSGGQTSWHGFASEIFLRAQEKGIPLQVKKTEAIQSTEYPTPAKRPLNSRLNMDKVRSVLGIALPDWKSGLDECFDEYLSLREHR
jgi:dTDP-4-dehydrorhamnose reductase